MDERGERGGGGGGEGGGGGRVRKRRRVQYMYILAVSYKYCCFAHLDDQLENIIYRCHTHFLESDPTT